MKIANACLFSALMIVSVACGDNGRGGGHSTDIDPAITADGGGVVPGADGAAVVPGADGGTVAPPASSACGRGGREGRSECRSECAAGQYCDDTDTIRECAPGCTSDEQCGPNDFCQRDRGAAIGTCTSCRDATFGAARASCIDMGRTGMTDCRSTCGPGQYCNDGDVIRFCDPGCTSDLNCGPTEYCDREAGAAVGVCASCYEISVAPPAPAPDAGMVMPPSDEPTRRCLDGCELAAFNCVTGEIAPTQVASCKAWCRADASDAERNSLMDCVEAAFFQPMPCAESECMTRF